jgi:hypothetical protein
MRGMEDTRGASLRGALPVMLRLLIGASLLLPVVIVCGETLVSGWLNAYRAVFAWVADDFKLLSLNIDHEGVDRVLRARVTWRHIVVVGDTVIYPDPRGVADASTLMAHALQGPLAALLAAIAWPLRERDLSLRGSGAWLEWSVRGAVLVPLLAILVLTDMPLVLAGELWAMVLEALEPDATSALVLWKRFLQGGGRFALGVAAGVSAAVVARGLCRFLRARFARAVAADRR